jgi:hypothetical protein
MEHDLHGLRATLLQNELYGASPDFVQSVRWGNEKSGHILYEKSEKGNSTRTKAVVSVVGRVLEDRLNCGANGNFINKAYGSLHKAKYQVRLAKPTETPFGPDFDTVHGNLKTLQTQRAATQIHKNLIDEDELRFSENVFEQRVSSYNFFGTIFAKPDGDRRPRRLNDLLQQSSY